MMSPLVSGVQLFAKECSLSEDDGLLRPHVTNNEHPCCHKWTFRCWLNYGWCPSVTVSSTPHFKKDVLVKILFSTLHHSF